MIMMKVGLLLPMMLISHFASAHITVPVNRLDTTLSLREEVAEHYWPTSVPLKFKDDFMASVCAGQSILTRYARDPWSLQMWDASGTSLVGTKAGAHQARGHQELCTKTYKEFTGTIFQEIESLLQRPRNLEDLLDKLNPVSLNITSPPISGRYCVVSIRSKYDASLFSSGSSELLASLSNHNTPNYATCVPDTCSEDLLQTWFQKLEGKNSIVNVKCTTSMTVLNDDVKPATLAYFVQPPVRETSDVRFNFSSAIHSNTSSPIFIKYDSKVITTGAIIFGVFACLLIILSLGASVIDLFLQSNKELFQPNHQCQPQRENSHHQIQGDQTKASDAGQTYVQSSPIIGWDTLQCFSIPRNWQKIFPKEQSANAVPVIDGLRCVCMFWVIIAHRFMFMLITSSHPEDLLQNRDNPNYWWLFNPYPSVDIFFVIAGFLLALTPLPKFSLKFVLNAYIFRYLRLAPSLIVTVWGVYSVLSHFGSGPIYDSMYHEFFGRTCEKSWLSSVLLMSNTQEPNDICLGHLWSLSVDWQLYLVGILAAIPLGQEGSFRSRYGPLFILTLLSIIIPGAISVSYGLPPLPSLTTLRKSLDYYQHYYVNTFCRGAPYFIGILGGRAHMYFKQNPEYLSQKLMSMGRAASLFILSGVMIFPLCLERHNLMLSAVHNTIAKPLFSIAIVFVIISTYHNKGDFLGWALSRHWVGLLARSSYCIYLISLPIQVWSSATNSTLPSDRIFQLYTCCGDMILSTGAGIAMTLLVELPFAHLLSRSIKRKKRVSQGTKEAETQATLNKLSSEEKSSSDERTTSQVKLD